MQDACPFFLSEDSFGDRVLSLGNFHRSSRIVGEQLVSVSEAKQRFDRRQFPLPGSRSVALRAEGIPILNVCQGNLTKALLAEVEKVSDVFAVDPPAARGLGAKLEKLSPTAR